MMLGRLLFVTLVALTAGQSDAPASSDPYPTQTGFVRVHEGRFVTDDCKEYLFAGFNAWELIEISIGFPGALPDDLDFLGDKTLLEYLFDVSAEVGLNVIRLFGHGTTAQISTQRYCCAGDYKEEVLQGLDLILDEAARRDMKVILTFGDNWRPDFPDTIQYYVNQSETAVDRDDFWFDDNAKQLYKNHITFMTNRVNTFNNRAYKDDPTIFAWNIINEPRCSRDECIKGTALADWLDEMAAHIKQEDPNHMITVGEEGFYSEQGCDSGLNPGDWAGTSGQNSPVDHFSQHIDFISSHVWPDNWDRLDWEFMQSWIEGKQAEAQALNKPLLLEEFGKATNSKDDAVEIASVRDPIYREVFAKVSDSLDNGGTLRGALFWTLNYGQPHDKFFGYGIGLGDTTWDIVTQFAQEMNSRRGSAEVIEGCVPGRGATFYSSKPQVGIDSILTPNAYDCCSGDCNSLYGWIQGDIVEVVGYTETADDCCATCSDDDRCSGYNWCSCRQGCAGFDHKTCILKSLPYRRMPLNDTSGPNAYFLGGVPGVQSMISHSRCQLDSSCAYNPSSCSISQLRSSVTCPDESCNAEQANYGGDLVTLNVEQELGISVTTTADCCEACRNSPECNVWVFCNAIDDCGDSFPYRMCTLKKSVDGPPVVYGKGEFQPWLAGYLSDKTLTA